MEAHRSWRGRVRPAGMKAREGFPGFSWVRGKWCLSSSASAISTPPPNTHTIALSGLSLPRAPGHTHMWHVLSWGRAAWAGYAPKLCACPKALAMQQAWYQYEEGRKAIESNRFPPHTHWLGGHIRTRWAKHKLTYAYLHDLQPLGIRKVWNKQNKISQEPLPTWSPSAPLFGAEEFDPGKDV